MCTLLSAAVRERFPARLSIHPSGPLAQRYAQFPSRLAHFAGTCPAVPALHGRDPFSSVDNRPADAVQNPSASDAISKQIVSQSLRFKAKLNLPMGSLEEN